MAGKITVSTINDSSGVLATQNGMTGIAKAWVNFNGGNGNTAGVINGSFNVSSITVNGTGDYTANFTTAMPNINYVPLANGKYGSGEYSFQYGFPTALSTTSVNITATYTNASKYNQVSMFVAVFSS